MTSLTLQLLDSTFLPAIVDLDQICFGGLWTAEGYQREMDSPNSDLLGLLSTDAQDSALKLVGLACCWAIVDEAHLTIVGIHPDYQRSGLGQLLICALLDRARQRGMTRTTLEVRISNRSAISLYEKFGFKVAGTRKKYYTDTGEDALILWRSGLQNDDFAALLATFWEEIQERLLQRNWTLHLCFDLPSVQTSTLTSP